MNCELRTDLPEDESNELYRGWPATRFEDPTLFCKRGKASCGRGTVSKIMQYKSVFHHVPQGGEEEDGKPRPIWEVKQTPILVYKQYPDTVKITDPVAQENFLRIEERAFEELKAVGSRIVIFKSRIRKWLSRPIMLDCH